MPVGYVTFSSETRNLNEIQDLALFRVRPMFGTLPGVSGRPPFGGNQRTIVINVDRVVCAHTDCRPTKSFTLSRRTTDRPVGLRPRRRPGESGTDQCGCSQHRRTAGDSAAAWRRSDRVPARRRDGPGHDGHPGRLRDRERSTQCVPAVIKRADASTLDVVNEVRSALPQMHALVPRTSRSSSNSTSRGTLRAQSGRSRQKALSALF